MAATLMEKERLLNLIAYAESIVLLRVAPTDLRDQLTRFLGEQRSRILAAAPEAIDINAIAPAIQDIPSKTSWSNTKTILFYPMPQRNPSAARPNDSPTLKGSLKTRLPALTKPKPIFRLPQHPPTPSQPLHGDPHVRRIRTCITRTRKPTVV